MSAKAWQWSLWLRETPWPQVSPLLLIRVWAPATPGGLCSNRRHYLFWRNDPVVSLWVEVSQLCLVMRWPWVGLSLEASREKRCLFFLWVGQAMAALPLTPEDVQGGEGQALVGVRCPHLSVYSLWLPKLPLGCSYYLWISKESLPRFWQRQNFFSL